MNLALFIAIVGGILIPLFMFFYGQHRGENKERTRAKRGLANRMIEEYLQMVRTHEDNGPSALAKLGLQALGDDGIIREAIEEMSDRAGPGNKPWRNENKFVLNVNLVEFFQFVRDQDIRFDLGINVEEAVKRFKWFKA